MGDALYSAKLYYLNHLFWSFADPEWTPQQNMLDFCLYGDPALARKGIFEFTYGDCNGDGDINVGDVVYLVNYLYRSGPSPEPLEAGDCNCDDTVNVGDVVYLVNYLYRGGLEPIPDPCFGDAQNPPDGAVDVGDVVYLVNYLYRGGASPTIHCCPR